MRAIHIYDTNGNEEIYLPIYAPFSPAIRYIMCR